MSSPSDHLATAAAWLSRHRPLLQVEAHLILSALFPIVVGSYASLSRPSSAAKPLKRKKSREPSDDDEADSDDEEEVVQKMEGLSPRDAVLFPVMAGTVLAGLYWLIKRYGADAINLVLGWYFSFAGLFSLSKGFNDVAVLGLGMVFPTYFAKRGRVHKVDDRKGRVVALEDGGESGSSPLPGRLGGVRLSKTAEGWLWAFRRLPKQKYDIALKIMHDLVDITLDLTLVNIFAMFAGLGAIAYNHYIAKPWWLTNLQGFSVSYTTLQFMSPTTFATGSLILSGLFCYDIWAVFFTPLMVTVATNLDQPIKLLFPKPDVPGVEGEPPPPKSYSMLGLGDIVLPGLMIGLALRFDLYMYYLRKQQKKIIPADESGDNSENKENLEPKEEVVKDEYTTATGHWGSRFWTMGLPTSALPAPLAAARFPKPYFTASMIGYVVGMLVTVGVMQVWNHAQPALLYLVPGVLISLWGTALARSEVKDMWQYSELSDEEDEEAKKKREAEEAKEKEGEEKKRKQREERGETGWLANAKVWLFGEPDLDKDDAKKAESEAEGKATEAGEKQDKANSKDKKNSKAEKDPDHIFVFSIRKHKPSKKSISKGRSKPEVRGDSDTEPKTTLHDNSTKAGSESGSSSEDAVLVSKGSEVAPAGGPATRTRRRGWAKDAKPV